MKGNELMIGNLFKENITGQIIEVIELKKDSITFSGNFEGKWQAEPITLTEEILLKCGFKIGYPSYSIGFFEILYNDVIGFRFAVEGQYGWNELKYLHQLQNLYFALFEDELIINL